ncbi:MAG TPA: SLC13 family permease [Acidimicrobiales bacterium]|jgi:arsenical pump membrane protein|nr:SLC13 family permease [Acidimicrobiales bacterium]
MPVATQGEQHHHQRESPWSWLLAFIGVIGAVIALSLVPEKAHHAAAQTWTPFVLVSGLLLIGLVAEDDGLFRAAGHRLARLGRHGLVFYLGAAVLITLVTATLNLDTSVVFLTPVLISAAHQRGGGERPLLYGCLLLSNASSLFLPGSNLTNLIVLGHQPRSGEAFLALMWPAALVACVVTACCVGIWGRRDLVSVATLPPPAERPRLGLGLAAVSVATVLVVVLSSPALPVLAVGLVAGTTRVWQHRVGSQRALDTLGVPVLVGLFGLTVALGALGRAWDGPVHLLSHADGVATALLAAAATVLINNLPAAALLAARAPHHASDLLVGLNLGPNLGVTGSLAWFLWLRVARTSGAKPSIAQASRLGLVVVPLSLAAALGALALAGSG